MSSTGQPFSYQDAKRDPLAVARLYANEDSDRGFLARRVLLAATPTPTPTAGLNAVHTGTFKAGE